MEWIIKIHLIHILRNHVSKEKYKKYFRKNFAIVPFNFPRIPQTSRFSFGHKTNWFRHFHFKKCQNVLTSFLEYCRTKLHNMLKHSKLKVSKYRKQFKASSILPKKTVGEFSSLSSSFQSCELTYSLRPRTDLTLFLPRMG